MNWTLCSCLFLVSLIFHQVSGGKLCPKDNWYDIDTGKCHLCETCGKKSLELESCSDFKNAICVDLSVFKTNKFPWHEMETMDKDDQLEIQVQQVNQKKDKLESKPADVKWYYMWDCAIFIVLCVALASVLVGTIVLLLKYPNRFLNGSCNKKRSSRFRLFSRDRLSTTEYMNNLATLDRRLAMDEILEKKKKAIFEPQLLQDNIYTDEVFIDISGLPRHYYEDLRINDNDQEPTESLLRTNNPQSHS